MATSPQLLLLDEPAAGMNEDECNDLIGLIRQIHTAMKYTIIVIEHHMAVVMELCKDSRIYVLSLGSLLTVGTPTEVQNNPQVIKAYLGERKNARENAPA
jgi:branched-chain amino acid transport system ATP-binding protein